MLVTQRNNLRYQLSDSLSANDRLKNEVAELKVVLSAKEMIIEQKDKKIAYEHELRCRAEEVNKRYERELNIRRDECELLVDMWSDPAGPTVCPDGFLKSCGRWYTLSKLDDEVHRQLLEKLTLLPRTF